MNSTVFKVKHLTGLVAFMLIGLFPIISVVLLAQTNIVDSDYTIQNDSLSNTELVYYGPNLRDFEINEYIRNEAPHLEEYLIPLTHNSVNASISPYTLLSIIESRSGIISNSGASKEELENPLDLEYSGFEKQIDQFATQLTDNYYDKLYGEVRGDQIIQSGDKSLFIDSDTSAATYALSKTFFELSPDTAIRTIKKDDPDSFYNSYLSLFPERDPLNTEFDVTFSDEETDLADRIGSFFSINTYATSGLDFPKALQFPYPKNSSWVFGGAHSSSGSGSIYSHIDFSSSSPFPSFGTNTSSIWVKAVGGGTVDVILPTYTSQSCNVYINHGGGWETQYYHLQNVSVTDGATININDNIANFAQSSSQAACNGGSASAQHVHFGIKYFGNWVPIDELHLSNMAIESSGSGYNYDTTCSVMYIYKVGTSNKTCAYNGVLNEGDPCNTTLGLTGTYKCDSNATSSSDVLSTSTAQLEGNTITLNDGFSVDYGGNLVVDPN